jgi:hypothetical protein
MQQPLDMVRVMVLPVLPGDRSPNLSMFPDPVGIRGRMLWRQKATAGSRRRVVLNGDSCGA